MNAVRNYIVNLLTGLFECASTAINVVLGGSSSESLSSRSYRCNWRLQWVINFVFQPISKGQHCRGAYNKLRVLSLERAKWPERLR